MLRMKYRQDIEKPEGNRKNGSRFNGPAEARLRGEAGGAVYRRLQVSTAAWRLGLPASDDLGFLLFEKLGYNIVE